MYDEGLMILQATWTVFFIVGSWIVWYLFGKDRILEDGDAIVMGILVLSVISLIFIHKKAGQSETVR